MLMFNFDFFRRKKVNTLTSEILNSKTTYLIILLIILIQFLLVGIIFFQNQNIASLQKQTDLKIAGIEGRQQQFNEKINALQTSLMWMQAQQYRSETQNENK